MGKKAILARLRSQRAAFAARYAAATTTAELDQLDIELRALDAQINIANSMEDDEDDTSGASGGAAGGNNSENGDSAGEGDQDPAARNYEPPVSRRGLNPLQTYAIPGNRGQSRRSADEEEDMYGTIEYRQAFRNYVMNGAAIPEEYRNQPDNRAAEFTLVSDVGAVIPTTILNRVIEDLTVEGQILNRISQTSYQGGVQIPISEINPEATWLDATEAVSEEQKAKMDAKITFAYHVLEARVSVGILAATVALSIFENQIAAQLKKAIIRALEKSIFNGTGNGQPKGILTYDVPEEQVVEFTTDTIGTVKGWAACEAAVPEAYETGEIYIMSKPTWEKYLNGMTDTTGQRIGLGKINEKGQKILNGREVLTSDQFASYDAAADGAVFGCLVDLKQYLLNSNLALYYKKWFDEDVNKWKHKVLMIADGQLAAGNNSAGKLVGAQHLILLKKKAGA